MGKFTPENGTVLKKVETNSNLPEVNIVIKELPSRGLPYPKNSTVMYRPYTFGEVKKASQMDANKATEEQRFDFVLDGVYTDFDKDLLTIPDIIYIAALRRLSTLGTSKAKAIAECRHCGGNAERVFDLTDIQFQDLRAHDLPIHATFSFGEMSFSPINRIMQKERFIAKDDNDEISTLAVQCISHEYKEAYKIIENMNPKDYRVLAQVDEYMDHGILPIEGTCTKCKKKTNIELAQETTLIFPFREASEPSSSSIRFGSQAAY